MADDSFTFGAKPVDQRADAGFVFGIGALDLVDFAVHQRFQFDGARERAFDSFAHGGDFAAHGLADHHDAVLRHVFRFREAEGHFGHRLGGNAHVLRAPDHGGECPEQDHRQHCCDQQADQLGPGEELLDGADLPDARAEQDVRQRRGTGYPGQ